MIGENNKYYINLPKISNGNILLYGENKKVLRINDKFYF